jgi:hypothetical protein
MQNAKFGMRNSTLRIPHFRDAMRIATAQPLPGHHLSSSSLASGVLLFERRLRRRKLRGMLERGARPLRGIGSTPHWCRVEMRAPQGPREEGEVWNAEFRIPPLDASGVKGIPHFP